ncbi:MAG: substrate-binding domain-containing protein, partial [Anaerolineae bacterium]|nr:substrate-binding domain-containing protein [Anaerolineae bacterium]
MKQGLDGQYARPTQSAPLLGTPSELSGASLGAPPSVTGLVQPVHITGGGGDPGRAGPRIALLVSDLTQAANREFVDGVVSSMAQWGASSVAIPVDTLGPALRRQLLAEAARGDGCDGVVLRSNGSDAGAHQRLEAIGWAAEFQAMSPQIPVVTVGVALRGARRIVPDIEDGVRQAVHHLVTVHGRRRFAFVRGPDRRSEDAAPMGTTPLAQAWERAYRDALSAHGLDADSALVVDVGEGIDGVYDAVASLLKEDPLVDAVLVAEAAIAAGVCNAIRAHALGIPEDTSVIVLQPAGTTAVDVTASAVDVTASAVHVTGSALDAFDAVGVSAAQLIAPTLTTVAPLERSLGAHAALALLRTIENARPDGDRDDGGRH